MRKVVFVLAILTVLLLSVIYYPSRVEKPVLNGSGPLAVYIDPVFPAPEYHSPLDWWQIHHIDKVNNGDFQKLDCLYCHEPEYSCNNCHGYVGANRIVEVRYKPLNARSVADD